MGPAYLSVDRARYYTESWQETEGRGVALPVRVALAMKNVYARMRYYVDRDDRIAGYWTEHFLGMPVDIERGVFNAVLASELTKGAMIRFRGKAFVKGLAYLLRKGVLFDFIGNQRIARASGTAPLNMSLKTMAEREINPYQIDAGDRGLLLRDLLPYWQGKTTVDHVHEAAMASGLYSQDMHDFVTGMAGNTSRQVMMVSAASTATAYQGHVIQDYGPLLEKGLLGMRADVQRQFDETAPGPERDFLESVGIALDGIAVFADRLADQLALELEATDSAARRDELEVLLEVCRKVPLHPAETFREAVQALWTVKCAVELAHPVNLHSFGRLDQMLYPYYRRDLEAGRITRDEACELLEEMLLKIMSLNIRPESNMLANFYHRYLGSSPVTLGGVTREGRDATNDLTYLFLDAAHRSKAITNVSVRIHSGTPDAVLERVAEYLHRGTSSFSLFNDSIAIEAMERRGFTKEDARDYAVMGCVEMTCPGKTGSMSANALLLSKLLDITLRNGDARTVAGLVRGEGVKTGEPDSFDTFEELLDAFFAQARYATEKLVRASNLRDQVYAECLPAPYVSAFMDGCLDSGKDVTQGGAAYDLSGISMINSLANVTDSLLVIKKLVFEERKFTFKQLLDAIDANFIGHEDVYRAIRGVPGKWGNGDPETDALARRVAKTLFEETCRHKGYKGNPFVVYVISMTTHTIDGRLSIASPDGRKAATPYAASCNPANVEKAGVVAALRSVAALPFEDVMGAAVNLKFHPSGIGNNAEARAKWVHLVRAYFALGGGQMQPTVASAEMLRAAQREPDQYRDLIVKVGGYSTYFVDLGREIQEEIIARTEHGLSGR